MHSFLFCKADNVSTNQWLNGDGSSLPTHYSCKGRTDSWHAIPPAPYPPTYVHTSVFVTYCDIGKFCYILQCTSRYICTQRCQIGLNFPSARTAHDLWWHFWQYVVSIIIGYSKKNTHLFTINWCRVGKNNIRGSMIKIWCTNHSVSSFIQKCNFFFLFSVERNI